MQLLDMLQLTTWELQQIASLVQTQGLHMRDALIYLMQMLDAGVQPEMQHQFDLEFFTMLNDNPLLIYQLTI